MIRQREQHTALTQTKKETMEEPLANKQEQKNSKMFELIKNAEAKQVLNNGERMDAPSSMFGVLISAYRQRLGLSVSAVSKIGYIPEDQILKIELGKAGLNEVIESIPPLSQALRVDPRTLSEILLSWVLKS